MIDDTKELSFLFVLKVSVDETSNLLPKEKLSYQNEILVLALTDLE